MKFCLFSFRVRITNYSQINTYQHSTNNWCTKVKTKQ